MADGGAIHFKRDASSINSTCTSNQYTCATFTHTSTPTGFYGSTIAWNGSGWNLRLKDGTLLAFPNFIGQTDPALSALLSIKDRYGNTVTLKRDLAGNLLQVTSPNGRWISFTHIQNTGGSSPIGQAQDDLGRIVIYSYSLQGQLLQVTDPAGNVVTYTYDPRDVTELLSIIDKRNNPAVVNRYDSQERIIQQILPDGSTYQFSYGVDSNGNATTDITDPRGTKRHLSFNFYGYSLSDTTAAGLPEQQTVTNSLQSGSNLLLSQVDQLGRQTAYAYDTMGNVTSITRLVGTPSAVTTNLTYDPTFNQLTGITDSAGHSWTFGLDSSGNVTSITDPNNNATRLTYNSAGQPLTAADALSDTAKFSYTMGLLSGVSDPLGNTASFSYDGAGRLIAVLDPLNNSTGLSYNPLDRITNITDAKGRNTSFAYDPNENLVSVTDALGNKTSYAYDSRDRRTSRTDALGNKETYTYDGMSNLVSFADRRGVATNLKYDGINRRTFAGFGVGGNAIQGTTYQSSISYTWDGGNRLTQATDSVAGTISRTYDGLDNLLGETTPQGMVSYTYDAAGRRVTMSAPGQAQTTYTWDNANRLTGITQGTSSVSISYDTADRRAQLTLPNGVTVAYAYDADSHLTGNTYSANASQLGNLTYAYDADGRRTQVGGSVAAVNLPSALSSAGYNANNEMTAFGSTTLTYDTNGNLTNDGSSTYTWDARNHLISISGAVSASFVYDALGRRSSKTVAANVTQFLYDGLNPIQELTAGSVSANLLTGLGVDQYFTRTDSSGTMAFLADALGSTVGLVNSAGSITTSYRYEPFGNATVSGTPNVNSYQFTGRENDGGSIHFYRARYYNSILQRFISEDPMDFAAGDTNLFGYVNEDPTNGGDYSGLCRRDPCADTNAVSFVKSHWSDAAKIASAIEVPTENVLGVAAEESGYGTSRVALEDNNFFGIHANPKALPPFASGSDSTALDGPVATYNSFYDSGRSFDAKFGGDVYGLSKPGDFTNALILAHFNTENKSFGTLLPSVIEMVRRRIHCHVRLIG